MINNAQELPELYTAKKEESREMTLFFFLFNILRGRIAIVRLFTSGRKIIFARGENSGDRIA
jgi:hypothetical protein